MFVGGVAVCDDLLQVEDSLLLSFGGFARGYNRVSQQKASTYNTTTFLLDRSMQVGGSMDGGWMQDAVDR